LSTKSVYIALNQTQVVCKICLYSFKPNSSCLQYSFYRGGGVNLTPPPFVVFFITQKVLVWGFPILYFPNYLLFILSLGINGRFFYTIHALVLRHSSWMTTFPCNKLNFCFDPLLVFYYLESGLQIFKKKYANYLQTLRDRVKSYLKLSES